MTNEQIRAYEKDIQGLVNFITLASIEDRAELIAALSITMRDDAMDYEKPVFKSMIKTISPLS